MKPMTARERRLVALGLLVLAVSLVYLLLVGPLVGGFVSRAQEKRELAATFQRDERIMASLPMLRASAEAQRASAPRFSIAAPGATVASEALKERLQKISVDEGFAVRAIEDAPADGATGSGDSARTIKVRADLTLTLTQLYETLRRLQNEDTYVVVDYLLVVADRSLLANRLAPLDVRLELESAWRPSGGRS